MTTTVATIGAFGQCTNNICMNNGVCFLMGSTFKCACLTGYTGDLCQICCKFFVFINN